MMKKILAVVISVFSLIMAIITTTEDAFAADARMHMVTPGETLQEIATYYGVSEEQLRRLNRMDGDKIKTEFLLIDEIEEEGNTTSKQVTKQKFIEYTVKKGDTLGKIAKAYGVPISDIQNANNMGERTVIYAGRSIKIPNSVCSFTEAEKRNMEEGELLAETTLESHAISASWTNIKLALDAMDKMVIAKDAEFNWWDNMGPCGKAEGYVESTILLGNGKPGKAYGGGICFVSTLLYQTVEKADGLRTTKRSTHSGDVKYADHDHDATVSYKKVNYKFKNETDSDVIIRTSYSQETKSGTIRIYKVK